MENTRENWDRAAGNYQDVFRLGLNDYNASLLRFWQEEGMLFPGARVIDIGCGVGKYGTYLAELGYDVTLTDISGEMLRHAEENMASYTTPWAVYRCDFNDATGTEPVFAGGFDFSISTMSPAIHDVVTVKKMSAMTRGWCFLARFYDWEQPWRDQLMRELGMEPRKAFGDLEGDVSSMIQAVRDAGHAPQVKYVDYNWADPRTPEQMADYMGRTYFTEDENRDALTRETLRLAKQHANAEGKVIDNVNTKVAWIWWKTEEQA
jgi:SAM-dependent methyltransferase